jgi:glucose/arabinose dehydrogenase
MSQRGRHLAVIVAVAAVLVPGAAQARRLPFGFADRPLVRGLELPTSVALGKGSEMYVAEKRGTIVRVDRAHNPSRVQVADLTDEVMSWGDRGLLSIALDPRYPERPYLYAAYTYDAPIGGTAPTWGQPGSDYDGCPTNRCLVGSRLSRLTLDGRGRAVDEQVLIEDWCQTNASHSIGDIAFDRHRMLLVSAGEGADYSAVDIGDSGDPPNLCADQLSEGGALRAQDALDDDDPVGLDGSIARIDPDTGAAAPGNGVAGAGGDPRIAAFGMRNPFRFTIRPGTDELWIGDVGWFRHEEIDRMTIGAPADFGWPCYEGTAPVPEYAELDTPLCNQLYASPGYATDPWFTYDHGSPVVPGDGCKTGASSISGVAFERNSGFPRRFRGALFFADAVRNCIWSIRSGGDGIPRPQSLSVFESPAQGPVDLVAARRGLIYPSITSGTIRLISHG